MCVFSKGACFGNCSSLDRLGKGKWRVTDFRIFSWRQCEASQLPPDRHPTNCRKLYFFFQTFHATDYFSRYLSEGKSRRVRWTLWKNILFIVGSFYVPPKQPSFFIFLLLCFHVHHFESDPVHQHLSSFPRIKSRGEGMKNKHFLFTFFPAGKAKPSLFLLLSHNP